eukprot:SAG11_NODE_2565_length_3217_cov_3.113534_3_plen_186_part_00
MAVVTPQLASGQGRLMQRQRVQAPSRTTRLPPGILGNQGMSPGVVVGVDGIAPPGIVRNVYQRAQGDMAAVDVVRVDAMLCARQQARACRDFATADRIRAELRTIGVEVDDRSNTWRGGGDASDGGHRGDSMGGDRGTGMGMDVGMGVGQISQEQLFRQHTRQQVSEQQVSERASDLQSYLCRLR